MRPLAALISLLKLAVLLRSDVTDFSSLRILNRMGRALGEYVADPTLPPQPAFTTHAEIPGNLRSWQLECACRHACYECLSLSLACRHSNC